MKAATRRSRTVNIIGGGVGGLTLALALKGSELAPTVYEARKHRETQEGGCYVLWYAGALALKRLGVLDEVAAHGYPVRKFEMTDDRGRLLTQIDVTANGRSFGVQPFAVRRADIVNVMVRNLGPDTLQVESNLREFVQDGRSVRAHFTDGREVTSDVLVGADGINSTVRSQLLGMSPPRHPGYAHFWGVAEDPGDIPHGTFRIMHGRAARFAHFYLGDGKVCWWCVRPAGPSLDDNRLGTRSSLASLFFDWPPAVHRLLANTETITRRDTMDRDPVRSWSSGRVTLLGDAAHPMTFDLGQGAGSALSDGVTLGHRLRTGHRSLLRTLQDYENDRLTTTRILQFASRQIGSSAHQGGMGPAVNRFFLQRFGPLLTPRIFELDAKAQNRVVGDVLFR